MRRLQHGLLAAVEQEHERPRQRRGRIRDHRARRLHGYADACGAVRRACGALARLRAVSRRTAA